MRAFVEAFINMRFEPSGMTTDPDLRFASSIMDYLFRWLQAKFLPEERQGEQLDLPIAEERPPAAVSRRDPADARGRRYLDALR